MKSFEYATPSTLKEATALLAETWGESEVLAGGTDLVTALKQGITQPKRLVSLRKIQELHGIQDLPNAVRVGATTTLAELAAHSSVRRHFPSLITAVEGIGSPQLLSVGTVGGDLCQRPRCWYFRNGLGLLGRQGERSLVREGENRYHAIFGNEGAALFVSASSLGPALVALGAAMLVVGPKGSRTVQAAEFFQTPTSETARETALRPNEILKEMVIPNRGLKNATYEIRHRHGLDWPYVTASVAFEMQDGKINAGSAKAVLGHVAPTPWLAAGTFNGASGAIDEASAGRWGEAAAQGAKPLSGNAYKVPMVKAAVKRALLAAAAVA